VTLVAILEDAMNAEDQRPDTLARRLLDTRRRIVEATSQLMRERDNTAMAGEMAPAMRFDAFLALLQDRLPVWNRVLGDLSHLVGKADVNEVLIPVARAAIEFNVEILGAGTIAFTSPDQLIRFRRAMGVQGLGPQESLEPLVAYLAAEQRLGRIASDIDPDATARLLLGACFQHAYIEVIMGRDAVPSREDTADQVVYGLRLSPTAPPSRPQRRDPRSDNGGALPGDAPAETDLPVRSRG
jgi:hypothetical protein